VRTAWSDARWSSSEASAVTLRDMAKKLQLQTSAPMYYFKNKTPLAAAVFVTRFGAFVERISKRNEVPTGERINS
jgi:hypothetical protein